MSNNYVLGRGEVRFSRFITNTKNPEGYRYLGNTPEFSISIDTEELRHFNSDRGIREQDDGITLEATRTGSLITDNISPANVALFFLGSESALTQAAVPLATETITAIIPGMSYFLGMSDTNPAGYKGIDATGFAVATNVGATALVEGTDYEVDLDRGMITFLSGSLVATAGIDIDVSYAVAASTREVVISGNQPVEGSIQFTSFNPKGADSMILIPWCKIMPAGDYALKGDEWQQIPLNVEIMKRSDRAAFYRDGMPAYS
jgi:hypothetical protein